MSRWVCKRRGRLSALVAMVALAALLPPGAARAQGTATEVEGGWIQGAPCALTSFDPQSGHFELHTSTFWDGNWTGVTHVRMEGTLDLITGDAEGTIQETFTGIAADGSSGSLEFTGAWTLTGATNVVQIEQRILGGTEDFEGSRGQVTWIGFATPACSGGHGSYSGLWSRP